MNIAVENYLTEGPEKVMAKHGKSFFWASQVFSKKMLHQVATLYTFCRYIDDLADECEPSESRERLEQVLAELEAGKGAFTEIFGPDKISPIYAKELLDGALFDVNNGEVHTYRDLIVYCYKVAGVVGLMMTKVIGVKAAEASVFAIDLGIGMQLTNICRDVLEDAQNNRTYLPNDLLQEKGLDVVSLSKSGSTPKSLTNIVANYLSLADEYYASATIGMRYIPWRARFAILLAARLYQGIGHKIRKNNYNVLSGRTFLNRREKALLTVKVAGEFFIQTLLNIFKPQATHQQQLHLVLEGLPGVQAARTASDIKETSKITETL